MTYKLIVVAGTRPQFIKAAPVIKALSQYKEFEICFIDTGQHYDFQLSTRFIEELDIPIPDYNLKIGSAHQSIQISSIICNLSPILEKEKPDLVIVFGDTNSTSGASICAASFGIPIAHIEAGLREWDKSIPEEINKLITDSLADLYFCPSLQALENLKLSGITTNVFLVGDVGLDLVINLKAKQLSLEDLRSKYHVKDKEYYFLTIHRAGLLNNIEGLSEVLSAINQLRLPVIFPIHPGTLRKVEAAGLMHLLQNDFINLIDPIGFIETQSLIKYAKHVITDSGGIIKEAYYHMVPSIIIDKQTEWTEIVVSGWAQIAGYQKEHILDIIRNFEKPAIYEDYFGDGKASLKIASVIYEFLQYKE